MGFSVAFKVQFVAAHLKESILEFDQIISGKLTNNKYLTTSL